MKSMAAPSVKAPPLPPSVAASASSSSVAMKSVKPGGVQQVRFNAKSDGAKSGGEKKQVVKGRAAVDSSCPIAGGFHVYEEGNDIYDVYLNQTDLRQNRNKYYIIQLLESDDGTKQYHTWNRWGRVGEERNAQNALKGPMPLVQAKADFNGKFTDKTKNRWANRANFATVEGKYTLIERDYGVDDKPADAPASTTAKVIESKLDKRVQDFISLIADVKMMESSLREIGFDPDRMPLGKLKKTTIAQAYEVLKKLSNVVAGAGSGGGGGSSVGSASTIIDLSNAFYSLIPHVSDDGKGGTRGQLPPIDNVQLLKLKIDMVEALGNIEMSNRVIDTGKGTAFDMHPIDAKYGQLENALKPIDVDSPTHKMLAKYIANTHGETHTLYTLELLQAFEACRDGEDAGFDDRGNRMLLWHGSRLTNWVGILSGGLRIAPPEAPVTGYMFGKGVYFADMVTKSANYCFANRQNPTGVLMLCDVALGKQYERLTSEYEAGKSCAKAKCDSTWGKGKSAPDRKGEVDAPGLPGVRVPMGKGGPTGVRDSSLLYNEFIVYDIKQIRQKYVLKVKFNYR